MAIIIIIVFIGFMVLAPIIENEKDCKKFKQENPLKPHMTKEESEEWCIKSAKMVNDKLWKDIEKKR